VDFNGRANRLAAQLVSFLEERMNGPTLHQANEENEEFCHACLNENAFCSLLSPPASRGTLGRRAMAR
jgi:hypothetical protein